MNQLANFEALDSMTPEQLDFIQQQIMIRKQAVLQQRVEQLEDKTAKLEAQLMLKDQKLETAIHRIDNIDLTNIDGDLRDRLNRMVRLYAGQKGIYFNKAWKDFVQNYNYAYKTNLELRITNYCRSRGIKEISSPEYLERVGQLEDAIRVADKMLNKRSA